MNSPGGYVYILYGDDTFGRDEAVQTLKERMRALPAGEHNMTELAGNDANVANLRMAADAVPFLADRRLVLVRDLLARLAGRGSGRRAPRAKKAASADSAADELQQLQEYLPRVPQTTSLAFVEDGRLSPEPLAAAIPRGRGIVKEFQKPKDVAHWIRGRANQIGVEVDESAVRELATLGGNDLRRLDAELRKLDAYAAGRSVTRADVRELVVGRDVQVWTLLDGLAERRPEKALSALRALYMQGESPEALLGRDIAPHYRRLMVARELSAATREERGRIDVTSLGLNPATLGRWTEQAERFEPAELERALEWLLDLDRQIKTGETSPEEALEVLVVQLSSRLAA
jgi:DNA polymerase-3 subunit delta